MSKILLSINPEYVYNIFEKKKLYEFRKVKCTKKIDKIIIYSTFPECRIVGEVEVLDILDDTPKKIWKITKKYAGITKEKFNKYYENCEKAIVFKLGKVKKYKKSKFLRDYGIKIAPQSFVYL